jgi:hypothetical protein
MTADLTAIIEDAAHGLPPERQERFMLDVARLLASHPAEPTRAQVELAIRLAAAERRTQGRAIAGGGGGERGTYQTRWR